MNRQAVAGVERKCRKCGRWTFFRTNGPLNSSRCPDCGSPYGKPVLGLDVTRFATPKPKLLKGQAKAMNVPKPKPGEFGA